MLQPLVVRLTFPKKLSQTYPSPVIPLQCPVVTKLYGVLLLKIFALMHLLSQLRPSPCPLVLVSPLLMRLSPCPVELPPSLLATLMACRLALLSMQAVKGVACLGITPPVCPVVPLNPVHLAIVHPAHPTGPSFLNVSSVFIQYC